MIDDTLLGDVVCHFAFARSLPLELRGWLKREAVPLAARAGQVLFDVGEFCPGFGLLTKGRVRVARPLATGRSIALYRVGPGESCVLTAGCLLGRRPNVARGVAEQDVTGALLPESIFLRLMDTSADFRSCVFGSFGARLHEVMQLVEELATFPLHQRLANLLLSMPDPVAMTHQGLADNLGTVREVVSRILRDFELQNLVRLRRGAISILDREKLSEIVSGM